MAVSSATELKILIKTAGDKNLDRVARQLENVGKNTAKADLNFKNFTRLLKRQEQQTSKNINNMRTFAGAWRELANSVDVTSREFRIATKEAERFERQAAKAQRRRRGGGNAGGALAAIGSAGLLGPEALAGAALGSFVGMPLAGAAIGSTVVAPARRAAGGVAESVADINRFRIALAGVSDDFDDYQKSTEAITKATKQFLLPIDAATKQYTRLKASVRGAGLGTEETTKAFNGIAAAIIATGGSSEDLNSALVATSQVFSKGKVSAEELRQQIGERLPGAFTIFAESIGKTPAQLDKALEKGEVSLADFITFVEELTERYGESAEVLAIAPENAGKRLAVALREAQDRYGFFFQKIGAGLQDNTTRFINSLNKNDKAVKQFITDTINNFDKMMKIVEKIARGVANVVTEIFAPVIQIAETVLPIVTTILGKVGDKLKEGLAYKGITGFLDEQFGDIVKAPGRFSVEDLFGPDTFKPGKFGTGLGQDTLPKDEDTIEDTTNKLKQQKDISDALKNAQIAALNEQNPILKLQLDYEARLLALREQSLPPNKLSVALVKERERFTKNLVRLGDKLNDGLAKQLSNQKEVKKELSETQKLGQQIVTTFAQGMSDALLNLFDRARSFRELLGDLLRQTAKLILNFGMQAAAKSIFPGLFATGGVMTSDGPVPLKKYAKGGIANSPQMALFGEGSTPEAYVPLPDGRSIPVKMKGNNAGGANVTVNVDANSSNVQGNGDQAAQLGKAIGAAVQQELIKQKKPGGLLY